MGIATALVDVLNAFRGVSVSGSPTMDAQPLRATQDPNDIQTPTVFVPPPDVDFQYSKRRLQVTWTAYLVAPNSPKQRTTTEWLSVMIDAVAGLFPFTSCELFSLTLAGGVPAQSYKLTWQSIIAIGE